MSPFYIAFTDGKYVAQLVCWGGVQDARKCAFCTTPDLVLLGLFHPVAVLVGRDEPATSAERVVVIPLADRRAINAYRRQWNSVCPKRPD